MPVMGRQLDHHADILERVGEEHHHDADSDEAAEVVAGDCHDVKRGEENKGDDADENRAADEPVLLAQHGEDVVVVRGGGVEEAELVERVLRAEALAEKPPEPIAVRHWFKSQPAPRGSRSGLRNERMRLAW